MPSGRKRNILAGSLTEAQYWNRQQHDNHGARSEIANTGKRFELRDAVGDKQPRHESAG